MLNTLTRLKLVSTCYLCILYLYYFYITSIILYTLLDQGEWECNEWDDINDEDLLQMTRDFVKKFEKTERSFSDHSNCEVDVKIVQALPATEKIMFSCPVNKFNSWGFSQQRTLMISNQNLFNIDEKSAIKKTIDLKKIKCFIVSTLNENKEFLIQI